MANKILQYESLSANKNLFRLIYTHLTAVMFLKILLPSFKLINKHDYLDLNDPSKFRS